jgi:hypothetical protein
MANGTIPSQILAAIKARKFHQLPKLFAPNIDFQAWTNSGHWVAEDNQTAAKIVEVWFSPGIGASNVDFSHETAGAKGAATLEYEVSWKLPDEQVRVLRQVYLMTIKDDRVNYVRVYCAGPHTEFPEVDLEKMRKAKGLTGNKAGSGSTSTPTPPAPRAVAAKAAS